MACSTGEWARGVPRGSGARDGRRGQSLGRAGAACALAISVGAPAWVLMEGVWGPWGAGSETLRCLPNARPPFLTTRPCPSEPPCPPASFLAPRDLVPVWPRRRCGVHGQSHDGLRGHWIGEACPAVSLLPAWNADAGGGRASRGCRAVTHAHEPRLTRWSGEAGPGCPLMALPALVPLNPLRHLSHMLAEAREPTRV